MKNRMTKEIREDLQGFSLKINVESRISLRPLISDLRTDNEFPFPYDPPSILVNGPYF